MKFFIIENKFEIIKIIKYSTIFGNLKHYLNLIDYLRNNVHYYVQLI